MIGAEPSHKCTSKKEIIADLAGIFITLRNSVPVTALNNPELFKKNLEKNMEQIEQHVLFPLHMWLETNGYCKYSPKSELPSSKLDSS